MKIAINVSDAIAPLTVLPFAQANGYNGDDVVEAGNFIESWLKTQLKQQYVAAKMETQRKQNQDDAEKGLA